MSHSFEVHELEESGILGADIMAALGLALVIPLSFPSQFEAAYDK